jgi:serine phosphatase RsbU (regulator of sigma subunit)
MASTEISDYLCRSHWGLQRAPQALFEHYCGYAIGGLTLPMPPSATGGDGIAAIPVRDGFLALITDGTGKGERAAALGRTMHNAACSAIASGVIIPADILRCVNRVLYRERAYGAAAVLHCDGERVLAAAAASPAPVLVYEGRMETLAAAGTMLGYNTCPELDVVTREIPQGAFLAMYSDAVTDAESVHGELFELKSFATILDAGESVAANVLHCIDAVLTHCSEQQDDLSLIVIQATDPGNYAA